MTGSAPKATEVTIPTVHDIDVSLHSQVILSDPIKAPYIGDNGNWYEYDAATGTFIDTGTSASGTPPITPDTANKFLTNDGSKAKWGEVNFPPEDVYSISTEVTDGRKLLDHAATVVGTYGGGTPQELLKKSLELTEADFPVVFYKVSPASNYYNVCFFSNSGVNGQIRISFYTGNITLVKKYIPALSTLYVTITQDGQDSNGNPIYKSDKTYEEIKAAHEVGREVKIANKGIFDEEKLLNSGINDFPLVAVIEMGGPLEEYLLFYSSGIPVPRDEFIANPVGGQPVSVFQVIILKSGEVEVHLPFFENEQNVSWKSRFVNKLPQRYLIGVRDREDGELEADLPYKSIQSILSTYEAGITGAAEIAVLYNHQTYRMVNPYGNSFVFSNTTPKGISTLTLSQQDGKDVWTHEVVSLISDYSFCPYLFLHEHDTGGYYLSDKDGNEVWPSVISNQYGSIQYIYYQRFKYTISVTGHENPYVDFLAVNGDEYARISVDVAANRGQGTVTWSGWKPICPNQTPEVTTADNGKFLRVVDGQWAADSVANAKGVSF